MPMLSSCSSASSDGNVVTVTIRVPPSCGSKVKRIRIVGIPCAGVPSGAEEAILHLERTGLVDGQELEEASRLLAVRAGHGYSERPPTTKSCRSNVAGHSGGPQKRSS